MSIVQVVVLALVQGLTEFLPVSSSAHLVLPSALLGWPDQGLAFDVAVHVGTLVAVIWYFRRELKQLTVAWTNNVAGGKGTMESRQAWYLILATIPTGLAGLLFDGFIETHLRSVEVITLTTIVFGVLLGVADRRGRRLKGIADMRWPGALLIGLSQALALIPGTSRSGITMTAALGLGYDRVTSARFSFLMSIPIIFLSGIYKGVNLVEATHAPWFDIGLAVAISAVTAYLCIHSFLIFVNRVGMMPFVWYRLALGLVLAIVIGVGAS